MRRRFVLVACTAALGAAGVTALAVAQSNSDPEAPQPPAPTLPEGVKEADDLPDAEREAYENQLIEALRPAPDKDGDPTTLEGVLPDGRTGTIIIQTSKPELYEGKTVDDLPVEDPGK